MCPAENFTPDVASFPLVLSPVFNDWYAYIKVLRLLDERLAENGQEVVVLAVDDGSTLCPSEVLRPENDFFVEKFRAIKQVFVLQLRQNVGHQRAIALGLSWVAKQTQAPEVVVMDADGEDDPTDVPRLLAKCREEGGHKIIMAIRKNRSESFGFRFCYFWFKWLFRFVTGQSYRMGNFSVIPRRRLESLVGNSGLWSHYAATVFRSRIPYIGLETNRAKRLDGESRMNFVSLIMYGLSAIAVFLDVVSVRMMIFCFFFVGLLCLSMVPLVFIRLFTDMAIAGWTSMIFGILLVLTTQALATALILSFITLGNRQMTTFSPAKDYSDYIHLVYEVK